MSKAGNNAQGQGSAHLQPVLVSAGAKAKLHLSQLL